MYNFIFCPLYSRYARRLKFSIKKWFNETPPNQTLSSTVLNFFEIAKKIHLDQFIKNDAELKFIFKILTHESKNISYSNLNALLSFINSAVESNVPKEYTDDSLLQKSKLSLKVIQNYTLNGFQIISTRDSFEPITFSFKFILNVWFNKKIPTDRLIDLINNFIPKTPKKSFAFFSISIYFFLMTY
jgi:hypothetical protein